MAGGAAGDGVEVRGHGAHHLLDPGPGGCHTHAGTLQVLDMLISRRTANCDIYRNEYIGLDKKKVDKTERKVQIYK